MHYLCFFIFLRFLLNIYINVFLCFNFQFSFWGSSSLISHSASLEYPAEQSFNFLLFKVIFTKWFFQIWIFHIIIFGMLRPRKLIETILTANLLNVCYSIDFRKYLWHFKDFPRLPSNSDVAAFIIERLHAECLYNALFSSQQK